MPRAGKIRWNIRAFQDLRRSSGVEARLKQEVDRVLADVGPGYDGGVEAGKSRSRGYVVTATNEAIVHEATDHALLRSLGSGS